MSKLGTMRASRPPGSRKSNLAPGPPTTVLSQPAADFRPPADYVGPRKSRMGHPPDPSMNPKKNSLPIVSVSKLNVRNQTTKAPPSSTISLPKCAPLRVPSMCGAHDYNSFPKHTLGLVETRKSLMRTMPSYHHFDINLGKKKKRPLKKTRHFAQYDFHKGQSREESPLHGIILLGGDHRTMVEEAPQEPVTPPPLSGRQHCIAQTDIYVEEIADNENEFVSTEMQCEDIFDEPLEAPPFNQVKEGYAMEGTQLDQWTFSDLGHAFDQTAVNLSEAVIMESLKQLQEEYELEALRKQHEYHKCLRNREISLLAKYKIAQAKYEEQTKYLASRKPWDATLDQIIKMVGFDRIRDIAPTHYLDSQTDQAVYELVKEEIEPTLQIEAIRKLSQTKDGRALLDAIIEETVFKREAEHAGQMYVRDPTKKGSLATSPSRMSDEEEEWNGEFDYEVVNQADNLEEHDLPPLTPGHVAEEHAAEFEGERKKSRRTLEGGRQSQVQADKRKTGSGIATAANDDNYDGDDDV